MKKLVLALLVTSSAIFGSNNSDDLEKAIKDSDIEKVQALLPKLNHSEIIQFLDFSQQIINQRKSNLECFKMNPTLPLKALSQKSNLWRNTEKIIDYGFSTSVASFLLSSTVMLMQSLRSNLEKLDIMPFVKALSVSMGITSIFCILILFKDTINNHDAAKKRQDAAKKREEWRTNLEKLYDNAIQIRMLLLENYNQVVSHTTNRELS